MWILAKYNEQRASEAAEPEETLCEYAIEELDRLKEWIKTSGLDPKKQGLDLTFQHDQATYHLKCGGFGPDSECQLESSAPTGKYDKQ